VKVTISEGKKRKFAKGSDQSQQQNKNQMYALDLIDVLAHPSLRKLVPSPINYSKSLYRFD
jgi:hypothetical protein